MVSQATRSPFCQKHLEMLDSVQGRNVTSWLSSQERKETPQRRVRQRVTTSAVSAGADAVLARERIQGFRHQTRWLLSATASGREVDGMRILQGASSLQGSVPRCTRCSANQEPSGAAGVGVLLVPDGVLPGSNMSPEPLNIDFASCADLDLKGTLPEKSVTRTLRNRLCDARQQDMQTLPG